MKHDIQLWLYTLFACGCITSVILFLMPDERNRGIAELGCSCVMIFALISPLTKFDLNRYLADLSLYSQEMNEEIVLKEKAADEIHKEIIEERLEEYILNEAESREIKLESIAVDILHKENGQYIPAQVVYYSNDPIPENFMGHIEAQLGVSKERQIIYEATENDWKTNDS